MNAQNNRVTLHGLVAKQTWNKKIKVIGNGWLKEIIGKLTTHFSTQL